MLRDVDPPKQEPRNPGDVAYLIDFGLAVGPRTQDADDEESVNPHHHLIVRIPEGISGISLMNALAGYSSVRRLR